MYTYLRILVTSSQVLICPCGVRRVARAFSSWCGSTAHESPLACNDNKGTKEIINYGEILQQLLLVNLKVDFMFLCSLGTVYEKRRMGELAVAV